MKKKLLVLSGMFAIAIAAGMMLASTQEVKPEQSSLLAQNIEAFAQDSEPGSGSTCPTGGTPHQKCPIWNVSYEGSVGWPFNIGMKKKCDTGGSYKCKDGKCPHGN